MAIYRGAQLVQARTYDTPDGTPHKCTGMAIAPEWLLTVTHCVEGPAFSASDILKVSFSNNKLDPGPPSTSAANKTNGARLPGIQLSDYPGAAATPSSPDVIEYHVHATYPI